MCEYGHGYCKAPDTECIHWMGTFCELDMETKDYRQEESNDTNKNG